MYKLKSMDNELDLELDSIQENAEEKLKVKNRFQQLSEKVILTSKERDELLKVKETLENQNVSIAKERDFFKDFSANVSKYPAASEYQEQILEKVKSGYSTEDAMVSVLNKEGKLTAPTPESAPPPTAEGGSAPTNLEGTKELQNMTAEEKFSALADADKSGDLARALFRRT